jgi:dTDP-glucose 4,6-dehydratase
MRKKILVTGAEGFIGSHLVEELVKKGFRVKALVLYNFKNSFGWIDEFDGITKENIDVISGDIRDLNFLINITKDVDFIFHLAALISIPYSYNSPKSYIDTNILGTYNILEASRFNKIKRIIITSTSEVYGTAQFVPITEKHPFNAQSPYAASKIAADQMALAYFRSFGLPITIVRPFNCFGPRQSTRAIIPSILTQILSKDRTVRLGTLSTKRDFTFVMDTVTAFICALNNKKAIGEEINIGSNFEVSILDIINILKKDFNINFLIAKDKLRVRPKNSEVFRLLASNKKAKKILNWNPKYKYLEGFKKALKKTYDWYKVPKNLEKFKSDIYNI